MLKINKNNIPDEKITAAGCLVVSADNKVVAFARGSKESALGLPAGKREQGESILESAVREVEEETGLVVDVDESSTTTQLFVYQPDDKKRDGIDEYCATYVVHLKDSSDAVSFKEANLTDAGLPEGHAVWVSPQEFINKDNSAFHEYNSELLKFAGLL